MGDHENDVPNAGLSSLPIQMSELCTRMCSLPVCLERPYNGTWCNVYPFYIVSAARTTSTRKPRREASNTPTFSLCSGRQPAVHFNDKVGGRIGHT
jgi:hypothetical protein